MTVTANQSFFQAAVAIYPFADNVVFIVSLAVLLFAVQVLIISLLASVLPLRPVLAVLFMIAAASSYFTDQYGVVIDQEMLRNILETNPEESADLLNLVFVSRMVLLGLLPAVLVLKLRLPERTGWQRLRNIGLTGLASVGLVCLCLASASGQYASFIREHKPVRYKMSPGYPLYSAVRFASSLVSFANADEFAYLNAAPNIVGPTHHPELVIMVVGETVRADHLGLNGYPRDTTPRLADTDRLISFNQIRSCGTSTAVSVPCMFSFIDHDHIDVNKARNSQNVLDVLSEAGINVLWRDNNSDSKGVAKRVVYEDFRKPEVNPVCDAECRDIGMLSGLQEYFDNTPGDKLVVLHQMGNHGPAYYKRYPAEFEVFTPVCKTNELSQCTDQEVINAYDNAVRYTDYFLSEVIALLQRNQAQYETTMFYVSDHGESLGENGLYLHGMPYTFAPEAQTHVPVLVWAGPSSDVDYEKSLALESQANSHDAVFDALLHLFEVKTRLPAKDNIPLLVYLEE